ncbi:MAG: discoidin domain-containing protein [Pseudomonadales bacterium]
MKQLRLALSITTLLAFSASANAQQTLVKNYENASLEIGQGYLTHYADTCYLLLPTHVATESGNAAALLGEGSPPTLGETSGFADLGDDVTLAKVSGALTRDCGFGASAISRAVGSLIEANGLATVRAVNGDGTVAQLAVTIFDDDGSIFLRVQPTNNQNQLRKGQSGSLLMSGRTPIGMLLSVDARHGVGKVIRLDAMLRKFDKHMISLARAPLATAVTDAAASVQVTDWDALPSGSDFRPSNLVATGNEPPWIAQVQQWPTILEFSLGDERVALTGVELDGSVEDAGSLPGSIEILISSTTQGSRWRSVAGGNINFAAGKALFSLAPSWARRVRLVFGSSVNGHSIALRRVRILVEP